MVHQCNDNVGHIFPRIYIDPSDTGGKVATGINDAGGNLPAVSTTRR
jgi:hypothetical protein